MHTLAQNLGGCRFPVDSIPALGYSVFMTMTYEIAMSAAKQAADVRMRAAGRTAWNRADYNEMVRTFNRLWPVR